MAQLAVSPGLRRLIKKIGESDGDAAVAAFAELPSDLDNEPLLRALLPALTARPELLKLFKDAVTSKNFKHFSSPSQAVLTNWIGETLKSFKKDDVLDFSRWILSDFHRAELMHPANAVIAPITEALTDLVHTDPNAMLAWFQIDFYLFDIWAATISQDQMQKICPVLAIQLHEDNLIRLFTMLSELPNYERPRGGPLPHKPWLGFLKALWHSQLPVLENVACAFIKGWQVDSETNDVFNQMLDILEQAPDDIKSHIKAGIFKFSATFSQHLERKPLLPIFDPVTCYQIVNRAEPDTTYEATKWAMLFADATKLSDLVNAVTEDVVKGTSSVLRRFPAFCLLVANLSKGWDETHDRSKADFAAAVHTLGRHWSFYRPKLEKEAAAEGQTHYFSSHAELIETSLGRVLARTLS